MPTDAPQPGWYPDPYGPALERWWDGTAWSGATRPPALPGPAAQRGSTDMASGQAPAPGRAPASGWQAGGQPGQRRGAHRAHQPAVPDGRRPLSRGRKAALAGVGAVAVAVIGGGAAFALTSSGTPATRAAAPAARATASAQAATSAPATRAPGSRPPVTKADVAACQRVNSAMTAYGNVSHRTETDVQHLIESLRGAEQAAAPGGTIHADLASLVAAMGRADGSATGSDAATLGRDCTHVTG